MRVGDPSRVAVLDGLRGLAILLVVVSHAGWPILKFGGIAGVTLFFVLSGYLITTILAREWTKTGGVDFREFYRRRALRLLPALVALCVLAVPITLLTGGELRPVLQGVTAALFYFANLTAVTEWESGGLGHTWSLAMEEQYYLAWPLLLVLLLRRGRSWVITVVGLLVVGSLVTKGLHGWGDATSYRLNYYMPWANIWTLLAGSALALAMLWRPTRAPSWLAPTSVVLLALIAGPMGLLNGIHSGYNYGQRILAGVLAGIVAVALVWGVVTSPGLTERIFQHRWMVFFGTISYGLYLWHAVVIGAGHRITEVENPWLGLLVGSLACAVAVPIAYLSYVSVERPFLRLKDRPPAGSAGHVSSPPHVPRQRVREPVDDGPAASAGLGEPRA